MTLKCSSTHCRVHKLCSTYRLPVSDKTVVTDHQTRLSRVGGKIVCHFFGRKVEDRDLSAIRSPNTFTTVGNEFVIPRIFKPRIENIPVVDWKEPEDYFINYSISPIKGH
jgi:hypothetical protein